MSFTVRVRSAAEEDIREAARWYESRRIGLGTEFSNEVRKALNRIAENPRQYQKLHRETHRALIERFPYGVFYKLVDNIAVVVAVMRTSRNPVRWQSRT